MEKYLQIDDNGNIVERNSLTQSSGATDAGEIVALNDAGKIDSSMLPPESLEREKTTVVAGEALSAGDIVYLYDDNGIIKARKASASDDDTLARGFVKTDAADNSNVDVYFEGILTKSGSSFTVGKCYFLSKDARGGVTDDVSTYAAGVCIQRIGSAISSTEIQFERSMPIVRQYASEIDGGDSTTTSLSAIDGGYAPEDHDSFIDGGNSVG